MLNNGSTQPITTDYPNPTQYGRHEQEIIRPKPRRFVDIRRVGGPQNFCYVQPPSKSLMMPFSLNSKSAPLLPAKPNSAPPRHTIPSELGGAAPQQAQYHNSTAMALNLTRPAQNHRFVPQLPQGLEPKRMFMSPQPLQQPYYEDLAPPGGRARPKSTGGVGLDWKSVENLPKSLSFQNRLGIQPPIDSKYENQSSHGDTGYKSMSYSTEQLHDYDRIQTQSSNQNVPNYEKFETESGYVGFQPITNNLPAYDPIPEQVPVSKMKSRRRNIQHLNIEEIQFLGQTDLRSVTSQVNHTGTGGSSSSEASSGHASMSDSQTSASPPAPADYSKITQTPTNFKSALKSVPEDDSNKACLEGQSEGTVRSTGSNHNGGKVKGSKSRHRNKDSLLLGSGTSGLEDIKQAIEQLTLRSNHSGGVVGVKGHKTDHHSTYSTSTYSSMSGSESDRLRNKPLLRHSSLETINTQVTSADEFVWIDSHNRLVELQNFPWTNHDILKVIEKSSRLRDSLERISMETVPRVSYLLQRAFVRIAREAQRLSKPFGFCTKHEVSSAFRVVLATSLADSCVKACLRAAAMFSVSTNETLHRDSKSARAGLTLHVGKFHRWMVEVRLGRYVHEFAAVHMTAGIENLIEDILVQALTYLATHESSQTVLTAAVLEKAIATNGDLWGLLQPFAYLNAGRVASGALALPRWASTASMDSTESSSTIQYNKTLEQAMLTTCVGSIAELAEILSKVSYHHSKQATISSTKHFTPAWSTSAIQTLFYFMRCSQLETADDLTASTATLDETAHRQPQPHHSEAQPRIQELVYERPFILLPPLVEWVRVASAHTEHRHALVIERDDVMQSARLLLPGIDTPPRLIGPDELYLPAHPLDEFECSRRLKADLAFRILASGRTDLIGQALQLMPPSKANSFDSAGLSPLILACLRGEDSMVRLLLDAGANPDAETPANSVTFPHANNEVQHWTALTFAALAGTTAIVKILLDRGANVEGGAKLSEERSTQTPLQVAAATGNLETVSLLLNYGANPFLSTMVTDSLCYMGSASRGACSAISVAAAHGQRPLLHKLLSHPLHSAPASREVLSLEEILAEGAPAPAHHPARAHQQRHLIQDPKLLTKSQMKALQDAMYQSAENGHLEITLDFRALGIPWTLHCWVNSLSTAHDVGCDPVTAQLLQSFQQILPNEDFTQAQFVEECLPLLFTIFRNSKSKNEPTLFLLAEILQACYGKERIKEIRDTTLSNGTRIDPKYVNNPELSDVQFRVEGKVFYAHKIVLVTSSPRFKSMLKSAPETNPPVIQIHDTRYHIFQMLMEYLYNGGCDSVHMTEHEDILELMVAANYFQLDSLLRFCETKCSQLVNTESVVSLYIHAKVYNAVQLLEYCQGFLLQNLVQILTFDDIGKKLIFGKRLHNHDVLAGLLLALQSRLRAKPTVPLLPNPTMTTPSYPYPIRKYK